MRLYRDVSTIISDNNSCNAITNDTTIYGFTNSNRTRKTYTLIEDTYYLTNTSTSQYGYDIGSYVCLTSSNLETLPSFANFLVPVYSSVAFSLSVCCLCLVWFAIKSIFGRRV